MEAGKIERDAPTVVIQPKPTQAEMTMPAAPQKTTQICAQLRPSPLKREKRPHLLRKRMIMEAKSLNRGARTMLFTRGNSEERKGDNSTPVLTKPTLTIAE